MLQENNCDRLLRFGELRKICGMSRSTVWRLQQLGDFPKPHKISSRAVGWSLQEVSLWLEATKNPVSEAKNSK